MKIPPSGTKRHKVMMVLYKHGGLRLSELCARMPTERRESVSDAVKGLVSQDIAKWTTFLYDLTKQVRDYLDGCELDTDDYVPQIVPPRQTNVFASSGLSKKYQISAVGRREGSNDFKAWPSKHTEVA